MNKTLTKADIVNNLHEKTGKDIKDIKQYIEVLLRLIKSVLKEDRELLISGFGKFEVYDKAARRGRNPQTEETIILPPRTNLVFRLSRKFRQELQETYKVSKDNIKI